MLNNLLLLLSCFVCLHSALTLFLNRKKNLRSQNIWMLCMFCMSVSSYIWSVYYAGVEDFGMYYKLDVIEVTFSSFFFPFIYLYIKSLTDESPLGWKEYICFLPGLFVGISSLFSYIYMGDEQATAYIEHILFLNFDPNEFPDPVYKIHYAINIVLYHIIYAGQFIFVMIYTIIRIFTYQRRLDEFYSNSEGKSLENLKVMLVGIFIMIVIYMLAALEMTFLWHKYPQLIYALGLGYGGILYYINYNVLQLKYTAENLAENLQQVDKEAEEKGYTTMDTVKKDDSSSIIKNDRRQEIVFNLNKLLDEDKIYLNNDLRLEDIVRSIQVNRTYMSMLINEEYQCNFSELINRRRIEYAKLLFISNPQLSHVQIAEQSGFVHAASFSRAFKKYMGVTFREWNKTV